MKQELEQAITKAAKDLFALDVRLELTRPDEQFGDYATNVALQLGKQLNKNPREIADAIAKELTGLSLLEKSEVAGPGFINLTLSDHALAGTVQVETDIATGEYADQSVVLEYSDPNPFKVLHAGHLYQTIFGEAVANLLVRAGAVVHRVNFGGDVGLHVGKTMWAIVQDLGGESPEKLATMPKAERSEWMAKCYVKGTNAYEEDDASKQQIIDLNKRIYQIVSDGEHDSPLAQIYWTCRQWSYDYFDEFYASVGTHFERYYPESETAPLGIEAVKEQLQKGVYQESDGAVVFKGEPYGLHTRVFINSHGLPTYEAKDVGLTLAKWRDYHFDRTIIITGNDIIEYMKVVLKSIEQFEPELVARTTHVTHGQVKLRGGVKMSSRKGNFLRAVDVLDMVAEASQETTGERNNDVVLGAIKYAFLKQRIGPDIIFDPKESVAIEGNSGPYLQYAHARARSILAKAVEHKKTAELADLTADERSLLRKITEYSEVVQKATADLMPHHICTYLYELAQKFNQFYEHNRVIGDDRETERLRLVDLYASTLKSGLVLLGIAAPERL
ncbi:MAG TPA: arginine--tRNA ligase [Candidatus Saccharimonadia bacterium]|nr:arginine--tRNA ligase [Candidatus Saccharimonadia bacterium]